MILHKNTKIQKFVSRIIQFKPYGKVFLEYGFEIWLVLDMKKDDEEGFKWVVWKGNEMNEANFNTSKAE